jgi:hypothetical protein
VSNRRNAYSLEIGYHDADFILVRHRDVGQKSQPGKEYRKAIESGLYERIDKTEGFSLWKRTDRTEAPE